jgi:hypothetical protein
MSLCRITQHHVTMRNAMAAKLVPISEFSAPDCGQSQALASLYEEKKHPVPYRKESVWTPCRRRGAVAPTEN